MSGGGAIVRHELESIDSLNDYPIFYRTFQIIGSLVYFNKMRGFDEYILLEFAQKLI